MIFKKALEGIKVLDLSRQFPGPLCSMILADFGADVLCIEDRRFINDMSAWPVMRNKRHMSLNLKTTKGKEIFYNLIEGADVVVEGFRPGATARMGVAYEDLTKIKPDIIYCSLSGYGQTGPYSGMVGHDLNYIATAGILGLCGEPVGKPIIPPVQIADISGGLNAAIGVLIALFHHQRTGQGQYIDVSLMDAAISFMTIPMMQFADTGMVPELGKMTLAGMFPFYNVYATKDGKFITIGAVEQRFWKTLCKTIGCEELEKDQYCTGERKSEVETKLVDIFKQKTRDQWFDLLKGIDVCVGKVMAVDEMIMDPQVRHRRIIVEVETPDGVMKPIQGIVAKLSETPGQVYMQPARFGQHTEEALKELGLSDVEIKQYRKEGVC
jgi:crotonobetainyl-CoA:carnitine CoA-transferase CaiB-like acyl-CoA transferase